MADRYWVGGNGTWDASTTTNWSTTSGGAGGASAPTSADNVFFDANSGGSPFTVGLSAATCANLTISTTNFQVSGGTITSYGSVSCSSATSTSNMTIAMVATSGTKTVDIRIPILQLTLNGNATFDLTPFDLTQTTQISLLQGTMSASTGNLWYAVTMSTSGTASRSIDATVYLTLTGANKPNLWSATGSGFSCEGTIQVSDTNNTFAGGGFTYGQLFATTGSGTLAITGNNVFRSFSNSGVGGAITFANGSSSTFGSFYVNNVGLSAPTGTPANLTFYQKPANLDNLSIARINALPSGILYAGASSTDLGNNTGINFSAFVPTDFYWVGGTGSWTSALSTALPNISNWSNSSGGSPYAAPSSYDNVIFDSGSAVGADFVVTRSTTFTVNNFTVANTLTNNMTFDAGIVDFTVRGNFALTSSRLTWSSLGTITFNWVSGTNTIDLGGFLGLANNVTFSTSGGAWSITSPFYTAGNATLTSGSLSIGNSYDFTCNIFASSNSNTRTLAFGTGSTLTVQGIGTVINIATTTGLTVTGSSSFNLTNSGSSIRTVSVGSNSWMSNNTIRVWSGSGVVSIPSVAGSLIFESAFSGSLTLGASTFYGSVTLSPNMTMGASTSTVSFAGTSAQVITCNGKAFSNNAFTCKGVGITLGSAFLAGTTSSFSVSTGSFVSNNYNITVGSVSVSGTTARTANFGSSTITITNSGTTAWNAGTTTNLTFNQTGTISMTSATAKTFAGGGLTYGTLDQGGAGTLTITGSNTFSNITATRTASSAATISFTASTTTTVSNFTASGQATRLLTLQSVTAGTRFNLSKTSGTVSVNYCSIKDSAAAGGALWQAYTSNGNVDAGNNTGWSFSASTSSGNFFFLFS